MKISLVALSDWLNILEKLLVKNTLKAVDDFKNKKKGAWSDVLWSVKVYIFWSFFQYTIHRDKHKWQKSFLLTKFTLFLSRDQTHHSFTFNSQFLYELKNMVSLSESAYETFHFRFWLVFIKVCYFFQQKAWTLWL